MSSVHDLYPTAKKKPTVQGDQNAHTCQAQLVRLFSDCNWHLTVREPLWEGFLGSHCIYLKDGSPARPSKNG
jgi:hypothetical protein